MSFDPRGLSVLHYVDAYSFTMWHYASPDDLEDIGANYFDAAKYEFNTGDIVYLVHVRGNKAAAAMAVVMVTDQGVDHSIMSVSALPRRGRTMTMTDGTMPSVTADGRKIEDAE